MNTFIVYSLKNMVRSWKKTLLFLLIIVLVTLTVCTGMSMTGAVQGFLESADSNYRTIGVLEFMGAEYPDESQYDSDIEDALSALDMDAITSDERVVNWDSNVTLMGNIAGVVRHDNTVPLPTSAVLVVRVVQENNAGDDASGIYDTVVAEEVYSYYDVDNRHVFVSPGEGNKLIPGHYYLVHGRYYAGKTSYKTLEVCDFDLYAARESGFVCDSADMLVDISDAENTYVIPEDTPLYDIADTYRVVNNSVSVHATGELESLYDFQQQTLGVIQGRTFTADEYETGAKVCIMTEKLAELLDLEIGDSLDISLVSRAGCTVSECYWAGTGFDFRDQYELVGLINTLDGRLCDMYIPKNEHTGNTGVFSYTVGTLKLENGSGESFYNDYADTLPPRIRLSVYDQGYSAVTQPLKDILSAAATISVVSALAAAAVTALFGFLFIYRQQDAADIMRRMGAKKRGVYAYFLMGSGIIALISAGAGAVIGYLLSDKFMALITQTAADYAPADLHFSNSNLSIIKPLDFAPKTESSVFILTFICIFALCAISCVLFARLAIDRRKRMKKSRVQVRVGDRSRSLKGGAWKYALLSVARGGTRSLIPFAVALLVAVLLCQLTFSVKNYEAKLSDLYENTEVRGYFTDIGGRRTGGLTVEAYRVRRLIKSGYMKDVNVTKNIDYLFVGIADRDGEPVYTDVFIPVVYDTLENMFKAGGDVIYTDDITTVPQFFYSPDVMTSYMDGYGDAVLSDPQEDVPLCVISTSMMEQWDIRFGDVIDVLRWDSMMSHLQMRVVGSYAKQGTRDHIYCQLSKYMAPELMTADYEEVEKDLHRYTFNSVNFTLTDSTKLSEFKQYLYDEGYSEVNRIGSERSFIVLDDRTLLYTASALTQRINYMNSLFPALYALVEMLGAAAAYALVLMRKREFSLMRSMGATPWTSVMSSLFEQLILCTLGALTGAAAWCAVFAQWNLSGITLTLLFIICWMAGSLISALTINSRAVMHALRDEE